jgi:hypothetical protein
MDEILAEEFFELGKLYQLIMRSCSLPLYTLRTGSDAKTPRLKLHPRYLVEHASFVLLGLGPHFDDPATYLNATVLNDQGLTLIMIVHKKSSFYGSWFRKVG